jgi:hypothetical protein
MIKETLERFGLETNDIKLCQELQTKEKLTGFERSYYNEKINKIIDFRRCLLEKGCRLEEIEKLFPSGKKAYHSKTRGIFANNLVLQRKNSRLGAIR